MCFIETRRILRFQSRRIVVFLPAVSVYLLFLSNIITLTPESKAFTIAKAA